LEDLKYVFMTCGFALRDHRVSREYYRRFTRYTFGRFALTAVSVFVKKWESLKLSDFEGHDFYGMFCLYMEAVYGMLPIAQDSATVLREGFYTPIAGAVLDVTWYTENAYVITKLQDKKMYVLYDDGKFRRSRFNRRNDYLTFPDEGMADAHLYNIRKRLMKYGHKPVYPYRLEITSTSPGLFYV